MLFLIIRLSKTVILGKIEKAENAKAKKEARLVKLLPAQMTIRIKVRSALTIPIEIGYKRDIGLERMAACQRLYMGHIVVAFANALEKWCCNGLAIKF